GEGRQAGGNSAELASDGLDVKMEDGDGQSGKHNRDNGRGDTLVEARQQHENGEAAQTQCNGTPVERSKVRYEHAGAGQKFAGHGSGAQTEKVLDLGGRNQDGDAVGEAD